MFFFPLPRGKLRTTISSVRPLDNNAANLVLKKFFLKFAKQNKKSFIIFNRTNDPSFKLSGGHYQSSMISKSELKCHFNIPPDPMIPQHARTSLYFISDFTRSIFQYKPILHKETRLCLFGQNEDSSVHYCAWNVNPAFTTMITKCTAAD